MEIQTFHDAPSKKPFTSVQDVSYYASAIVSLFLFLIRFARLKKDVLSSELADALAEFEPEPTPQTLRAVSLQLLKGTNMPLSFFLQASSVKGDDRATPKDLRELAVRIIYFLKLLVFEEIRVLQPLIEEKKTLLSFVKNQ